MGDRFLIDLTTLAFPGMGFRLERTNVGVGSLAIHQRLVWGTASICASGPIEAKSIVTPRLEIRCTWSLIRSLLEGFMPSTKTHAIIGTGAGSLVAFLASQDLPPEARMAISIGGALGGRAGGRVPDALEPAIHSWHRSFFHSAAVGAGVFQTTRVPVMELVNNLLKRAAAIRQQRRELGSGHPDHTILWLQEFGLYFYSGLLIGLPVGYLSHLIADLGTDRGIPLIAR